MNVLRGATAEISLDALSRNFNTVQRLAPERPVIAVVKADAYGHGVIEVSKRLEQDGVSYLAVAYAGEGVALREAGIKAPVLVLFDNSDLSCLFDYRLTPVVYDLATAARLSAEAMKRGQPIDVHLKVDTGMGRLGFSTDDAAKHIRSISAMDHVRVSGLMSHFSEADVADRSFAELQLRRFNELRESIANAISEGMLCHLANSAATIAFGDAHLDAVRPGIMLYGCSPFRTVAHGGPALVPVMNVTTQILSLRRVRSGTPISYGRTFVTRRDSLIGVLPLGYADGYDRVLSNSMDVLVRGRRAPVVGRVCMDLTMVDVTDVEGVEEGDVVVVLGRQGSEEITAWEMAEKAGTIPYDIFTSLGARSKKIYT